MKHDFGRFVPAEVMFFVEKIGKYSVLAIIPEICYSNSQNVREKKGKVIQMVDLRAKPYCLSDADIAWVLPGV